MCVARNTAYANALFLVSSTANALSSYAASGMGANMAFIHSVYACSVSTPASAWVCAENVASA